MCHGDGDGFCGSGRLYGGGTAGKVKKTVRMMTVRREGTMDLGEGHVFSVGGG